jgi:hypothetical protein
VQQGKIRAVRQRFCVFGASGEERVLSPAAPRFAGCPRQHGCRAVARALQGLAERDGRRVLQQESRGGMPRRGAAPRPFAAQFRRKTILPCFDAASLDRAWHHQSSCLPISNMANSRDREDALTARVAKLEAELAASKRETEAWRSMLVRTARVLAAFTSGMDDSLESFRSPSSPIVVPDSIIDAARTGEPPDGLN